DYPGDNAAPACHGTQQSDPVSANAWIVYVLPGIPAFDDLPLVGPVLHVERDSKGHHQAAVHLVGHDWRHADGPPGGHIHKKVDHTTRRIAMANDSSVDLPERNRRRDPLLLL